MSQPTRAFLGQIRRRLRMEAGISAAVRVAIPVLTVLLLDGALARIATLPTTSLVSLRLGLLTLPLVAFAVATVRPLDPRRVRAEAGRRTHTGSLFLAYDGAGRLSELAGHRAEAVAQSGLPPNDRPRFPPLVRVLGWLLVPALAVGFAPGRRTRPIPMPETVARALEEARELLREPLPKGLDRDQRRALEAGLRALETSQSDPASWARALSEAKNALTDLESSRTTLSIAARDAGLSALSEAANRGSPEQISQQLRSLGEPDQAAARQHLASALQLQDLEPGSPLHRLTRALQAGSSGAGWDAATQELLASWAAPRDRTRLQNVVALLSEAVTGQADGAPLSAIGAPPPPGADHPLGPASSVEGSLAKGSLPAWGAWPPRERSILARYFAP